MPHHLSGLPEMTGVYAGPITNKEECVAGRWSTPTTKKKKSARRSLGSDRGGTWPTCKQKTFSLSRITSVHTHIGKYIHTLSLSLSLSLSHTHTHIYIYVHTHIYKYIHTLSLSHTHTHTHTHSHIIYTEIYTDINIHKHAEIHICIYQLTYLERYTDEYTNILTQQSRQWLLPNVFQTFSIKPILDR